jgi:hypothetical protein
MKVEVPISQEMSDVLLGAQAQVVNTVELIALLEKRVVQVAADKSGASGY